MAKLAAVALVLVAVCSVGSEARAQVANDAAHCAWLKLKAKASGFELEAADAGLGPKRSASATCYMQLVYSAPDKIHPNGSYAAPVLCPADFATWQMTGGLGEGYMGKKLADGNVLSMDNYLTFTNEGGDSIEGFSSARLLITTDKLGAFKKATLTSFSGELAPTALFNDTPAFLFGSFTVKGSTVTADKVPQPARDLVSGGVCSMMP